MSSDEVMRKSPAGIIGALLRGTLAVVALLLVVVIVLTPLDLRAQTVFGAIFFALCAALSFRRSRLATLALVIGSIAVSTRYLYWRLTMTVPVGWSLDVVLGGLLLFAELYAYVVLLFGYLQSVEPIARKPLPLPDDPTAWPSVDVFIPTYSEDLSVVRPTVLAAQALDWPADKLNVYLLDDGARAEFRAFAAQAGVHYLARRDNTHAKAGNINAALSKTRGELIAIFDSDHVPTRSFLQTTVGWLVRDPKIALVQTPHHMYAPDPFERNLGVFRRQPAEGELFYGLLQRGNDLWNAAFFCGSCALLRRSALLEIGGVAVETVTEDAHTALRMQRRGYDTAYIDLPQAAGLATETLRAHIRQRQRWARGMVQIFRIDNPLFGRGLSLSQRLCYTAAMLHHLCALPRLVFLLSPLCYLLLDAQIFNAAPLLVVAYAAPHLAHAMLTNSLIQGRHRHSFWSDVYEAAIAPFIALPTALALIAPAIGGFNVTAKGARTEQSYLDRRLAAPYVVISLLLIVGMVRAGLRLYRHEPHADVVLLNLVWAAYSLVIALVCIAAANETRQRRTVPRVTCSLPASIHAASGHVFPARTQDLSVQGATVECPGAPALDELDAVQLSLRAGDEAVHLEARVIRQQQALLRLHFHELSLNDQRGLARALFGRADAWVDWNAGLKRDVPLLSLLRLGRQALRGLSCLLRFPFARRASGASPS